jgi:diguanylate cyclase (GGDEF)-like protein
VEIIRDISERIENENFIREMAFLDPLTGLANRRLFEDRLEQALAKSRRYRMQFGLITLDLDNFKEINDTFGHEAGDKVLREAADRIRACCKRDLDTISRLGGDEFCIICTDCNGREQLAVIAEELLIQFERPFQLGDSRAKVTTSIGISMFPDNGTKAKELEIASDRAMYAAKKAGRNTCRFWEAYTVPRQTF